MKADGTSDGIHSAPREMHRGCYGTFAMGRPTDLVASSRSGHFVGEKKK